MLVGPLNSRSYNAAICCLLVKIGLVLEQSVRGLEVTSVEGGAVTNDNLRRVLVGHDNCWLGKLRAHSSGVVWHQWLLGHAYVVV